jgi:hypothetical protein
MRRTKFATKARVTLPTTPSLFEKYRGIGNPGIPSGRKSLIRYVRKMRGDDGPT